MSVELKEEDRNLLKSTIKAISEIPKPSEAPKTEEKTDKGHKSLAERMLCKDCNPPEEYKKAHLALMGQKECKECGNIEGKDKEECSDCYTEYPKET